MFTECSMQAFHRTYAGYSMHMWLRKKISFQTEIEALGLAVLENDMMDERWRPDCEDAGRRRQQYTWSIPCSSGADVSVASSLHGKGVLYDSRGEGGI
jgi:hypothetical protein